MVLGRMTWVCRLFGHWYKRGAIWQGDDHVGSYEECRICGEYREKLWNGWRRA